MSNFDQVIEALISGNVIAYPTEGVFGVGCDPDNDEAINKLLDVKKRAVEKGLILVDTKYEFGKVGDKIYLIDEIHTPDSSRYFYADKYEERFAKGEQQKQLSKEFVREWLMKNGFQGKEGQQIPEMTPEIVESISNRYIELFEQVTGEKFVKTPSENVLNRIEENIEGFLKERSTYRNHELTCREKYYLKSLGSLTKVGGCPESSP